MIEENIIEWLELGDSIQKIDLLNEKKYFFLYKTSYLLLQYSHFPEIFYFVIIVCFFAQLWELNLLNTDVKGDGILEVIKYLEKIFLFRELATNDTSFYILFFFSIFLYTLSLILAQINMKLLNKKKKISFLAYLNSLINTLLLYFLSGPCAELIFSINLCTVDSQKVLCPFKSAKRLIILLLSIVIGFFIIICTIISSIFINDVGTINGSNVKSKINCNFTPIIVTAKSILFVGHFFLKFVVNLNYTWFILGYQIFFIIFGTAISFYAYKKVFYYNQLIDAWFHYGCYYTTWFSFCVFIKYLFRIQDLTLFVIFGLILITIGFYFNKKYRIYLLLTEFNVFETNELKEIEIYNSILIILLKSNDHKSKIIISGVIKRFEEYINNNLELNEQYHKLLNDKHLQKKFSFPNELKILSMISIIYSYNIEKQRDATDITLNMCYFLINKFKNPIYAIWLCTRIKECTIVQSFYKYVLMQQIKDYLIEILNKRMNKLTLKHVQISSVILYNQYVDLFKIKIYDATCSQIEYFDILKNNITNSKTTENFLKIGEDILSLRKDILNIWEKIILLNPFSNESEKDYMIYLQTILQDDVLMRNEEKRYNTLKAEKLCERNNAYYSLFIQELSAVLLVNGYSYNGKIIYTTPNFPLLFMFTGKEILNASIDDLLPELMQNFHRFLIEDAIKYSNLGYIFKKQRDVLLKGKSGIIFNVYLYVKPVPNLNYGLIYFSNLHKIQDQNFILILNDNLYINGFTGMNQIGNFTINNNYGLSYNINGHHIGLIIPEIILQMNFDTKTNTFFLSKNNIDLKGSLYSVHSFRTLDEKMSKLLEALKYKKVNELNADNKCSSFEEYDEFITELNSQKVKPYSIFFRIVEHSFIGGKYKYYRIYIINDLLSGNENMSIPSNLHTNINDENNNYNINEQFNDNNKVKLKDLIDNNHLTLTDNKMVNQNLDSKFIRLKTETEQKNNFLKFKIENTNRQDNQTNMKEINLNEEEKTRVKNNFINSSENNNQINDNNFSKPSSPSSLVTQSSADSAEFNKLKNEIINKSDSFYVKLMKYLSLFYIIMNVMLIFYDSTYINIMTNKMIEFLRQNLYFTHTKIGIACIYNTAFNLKLIKENYMSDDKCEKKNCHIIYSDLLKTCIKEITNQKSNIAYFYSDFQIIFNQKIKTELYIYNRTVKDSLNLDIDNFLNLIIAHGMKVIENLSSYLSPDSDEEKVGIIDVYLQNLITNSLKYFHLDYFGFTGSEKESRCFKVAENTVSRVLMSILLVVSLVAVFYYYIYRIYNIEIYFLDRLINFSSTGFEEYLKKLEELKKKFRDDANDDDDKNIDELELKNEEVEGKIESKKSNKKKSLKESNKSAKNKKNKQNKIQQQKLKKKKIMLQYFFKYNILFALKIGLILIISTIYFILTIILTNNMKNNYKEFDYIVEQINDVYIDSFKIFLNFKEQIQKYFNSKNISDLNIPKDADIERPKLGNNLMYITRRDIYSSEGLALLDNLYNNDVCKIIAKDEAFHNCETIFSSILSKGMEQAIIQMSVIITTCIDELNSVKKSENISFLFSNENDYSNYEIFVGQFMLKSFLETQKIFNIFRNDEKNYMTKINRLFLSIYFILFLISIVCMTYFIYSYKNVINSFLNFIGILPAKYLTDDDYLYKTILKLEQNFY